MFSLSSPHNLLYNLKINAIPFIITRLIYFQRRISKSFEQLEMTYGNDNEPYEAIRMRVLQECAVINAIETLQER